MKILRLLIPSLALGLVLSLASCGGEHSHTHDASGHSQNAQETTEAAAETATPAEPHGEGQAYNAAYVCPMHCPDSGSDAPGVCPACGMDYIASADHRADGHSH